jgi:hypothetical protein
MRSPKNSAQSTCTDYLNDFYAVISCIQEKYNGTEYGYQNTANDDYTSIRVLVLDVEAASFDLQKECEVFGSSICKVVKNGDRTSLTFDGQDTFAGSYNWVGQVDNKILLYYVTSQSDQWVSKADKLVSTLSKDFDPAKVNPDLVY